MLERVGLGRRGVAAAQAWQLGFSVLVALVAAVITTYLVTPVGAALFDLDRTAHPAFEFRVALPALAITLVVAVVGFVVARVSASSGSRAAGAEEVVLRDG
jgi:hypothetical protein